MKRIACLTMWALALLALPAAGQSIFVGVGPTFPTSDYGDYAKTGYMVAAGVTYEIVPQVAVYGEGFWGQNDHETDGDKTNPYGFMAGLIYDFIGDEDAPLSPYAFAGLGSMTHKYTSDTLDASGSESAFGFEAGAGLGFDLGGLNAWGEGRYMSASFDSESPGAGSAVTAFFALVFGLSFNLGGS